jgi:threonyl-tRNA synthetase
MQAKIRQGELQKIPYMLIVGNREQEEGAVSVRLRSGEDLGALSLDALLERLHAENAPFGQGDGPPDDSWSSRCC